ncbi:MAG TPA: hypothetical protein VLH08_11680 [Acidobacteriota bacterium]|nr:hypothetical protein [Acidobacteriota bacterium]
MKVNTDKTITPQASSNLPAPEPEMKQETNSNSAAVVQNVTNTGSKQIAQQGLSVMSLQGTVTRTDLQKQFEENTRVGNGKLDQAADDRVLQGNQLANELTQKKPFDLVQNETQNGNVSVRPGLNQNELLPGLDNHSKNDQNLKSIFQDAMSGKSPSQQPGSTLIDGVKTPSHNLGEGSLLSATDTPGFKQEVDPLSFKEQVQSWKSDCPGPENMRMGKFKTVNVIYDHHGITATRIVETGELEIHGGTRLDPKNPNILIDNKGHAILIRHNADGTVRIGNLNKIMKEEAEARAALKEKKAKQNNTKRPADDAPERSNAGPAPSTTPYNNLVDNEFATFDSTGVDKYLRLAKGIQNTKVNPNPDGSEGSQGGPAPNEPVPGSGVVDPPDRPVRQTKGPIPVTGPIRRAPGGIPR